MHTRAARALARHTVLVMCLHLLGCRHHVGEPFTDMGRLTRAREDLNKSDRDAHRDAVRDLATLLPQQRSERVEPARCETPYTGDDPLATDDLSDQGDDQPLSGCLLLSTRPAVLWTPSARAAVTTLRYVAVNDPDPRVRAEALGALDHRGLTLTGREPPRLQPVYRADPDCGYNEANP